MVRVWFRNGTYKDVLASHAWEYENDPDYERTDDVLPEFGESRAVKWDKVQTNHLMKRLAGQ